MDGDGLGDDHLLKHPGVLFLLGKGGGGTTSSSPYKEGMGRDFHLLGLAPCPAHPRGQFQLSQGHLTVKNLDAGQGQFLIPGGPGHQVHTGPGLYGGVGFLQTVFLVRSGNGQIGGQSVPVGGKGPVQPFPRYPDLRVGDRGGLAHIKGADPQNTSRHKHTPFPFWVMPVYAGQFVLATACGVEYTEKKT